MKYYYSPLTNGFMLEDTAKNYLGGDLIEVSESVYKEFVHGSKTKIMVPGVNGPAWKDIPEPTNSELLSIEITNLSVSYKKDIFELNTSYLAAIVNDGPSEVTKQSIVRDQITQRKNQYAADIAAAKEKYPI